MSHSIDIPALAPSVGEFSDGSAVGQFADSNLVALLHHALSSTSVVQAIANEERLSPSTTVQ